MMKKEFLFFLLILVTQFTFGQVTNKNITEFDEVTSPDFVLIDVRAPEEYAQGYINKAVNISIANDDFVSNVEQINKNKKVYLYCKAGGRSAKASKILDSLGFKNITNLEGGFDAWKKAGKAFIIE